MKTLIFILAMLVPSSVLAKDVSIKNESGGDITFTEYRGNCAENRLKAYATSKSGQIRFVGCWFYSSENEKAYIVWEDGTVYEYK